MRVVHQLMHHNIFNTGWWRQRQGVGEIEAALAAAGAPTRARAGDAHCRRCEAFPRAYTSISFITLGRSSRL